MFFTNKHNAKRPPQDGRRRLQKRNSRCSIQFFWDQWVSVFHFRIKILLSLVNFFFFVPRVRSKSGELCIFELIPSADEDSLRDISSRRFRWDSPTTSPEEALPLSLSSTKPPFRTQSVEASLVNRSSAGILETTKLASLKPRWVLFALPSLGGFYLGFLYSSCFVCFLLFLLLWFFVCLFVFYSLTIASEALPLPLSSKKPSFRIPFFRLSTEATPGSEKPPRRHLQNHILNHRRGPGRRREPVLSSLGASRDGASLGEGRPRPSPSPPSPGHLARGVPSSRREARRPLSSELCAALVRSSFRFSFALEWFVVSRYASSIFRAWGRGSSRAVVTSSVYSLLFLSLFFSVFMRFLYSLIILFYFIFI